MLCWLVLLQISSRRWDGLDESGNVDRIAVTPKPMLVEGFTIACTGSGALTLTVIIIFDDEGKPGRGWQLFASAIQS